MKFVKEFVVPTAVLAALCLVISAALAATYDVTAPIIEVAKIEAAKEARQEVLKEASNLVEVTETTIEGIVDIYKEDGVGYVITAQAKGYNGPVNVMVGIKTDGTIEDVRLMENSESQGIGTKTGEPDYTNQYKGKDASLEGVDTISGATVTSAAFETAVGIAMQAYGELEGVEVDAQSTPSTQEIPNDAAYTFTTTIKGYASDIEVQVAFDNKGAVIAVVPDVMGETPGFGQKYADASYLEQWVGKTEGEVDIISGATVTGNAINKALAEAFADEQVKALGGE